jgi:hypothetical protein
MNAFNVFAYAISFVNVFFQRTFVEHKRQRFLVKIVSPTHMEFLFTKLIAIKDNDFAPTIYFVSIFFPCMFAEQQRQHQLCFIYMHTLVTSTQQFYSAVIRRHCLDLKQQQHQGKQLHHQPIFNFYQCLASL